MMAHGRLMKNPAIDKNEFVHFLKWCLPKLNLRWSGFRKVRDTVRKRLARRIKALGLKDLAAYRERLESDPAEWLELDQLCRIPISRFYRDKGVYKMLSDIFLPGCADAVRARGGGELRILSAGCASGEEPYTISVIWWLRLAERYPGVQLQILALDVDDMMLHRARTACYSAGSFKDMPADLLENGFRRTDGEYCLRDAYRRGVQIAKADLRENVPAGPFDVILCRNTAFTYFDDATQEAVFARLDASLREGGYLIIGSHEALPAQAQNYQRLQPGVPAYRKGGKNGFHPVI